MRGRTAEQRRFAGFAGKCLGRVARAKPGQSGGTDRRVSNESTSCQSVFHSFILFARVEVFMKLAVSIRIASLFRCRQQPPGDMISSRQQDVDMMK